MRVAVAGSVLSTSLVGWIFGHATISVHLGEVEGTVETAREGGDINIEGELLVEGLEDLVGSVGVHEVGSGSDVGVGARSDELQGEGIAGGGDTIGSAVIGTVESAVGSAGGRIGTKGRVPLEDR